MQAILPGQPQAELHALDHGYHEDQLIVVYLSGSSLVILDGPQPVLQTIQPDDSPSAEDLVVVKYQESTARIAVASARRIYIYGLRELIKGTLRWVRELSIRAEKDAGDLTTLSWGSDDELLVGSTKQISLYDTHLPSTVTSPVAVSTPQSTVLEPAWSRVLPSPLQYAELSPSASLIASVSRYDCLVKIWRRLSFELPQFDYAYLRHLAPVTHLEWRQVKDEDDVLFTICVDGVFRVWKCVDAHGIEILSLFAEIDMSSAIQPREPLSSPESSVRRYAFVLDVSFLGQAAEQNVDTKSLDGQALHAHEYFQEIASRKPDIVVVADDAGHMSAWGLESVGCKRRISNPKAHATVFHINHLENVPFGMLGDLKPEHTNTRLRALRLPAAPGEVAVLAQHFDGKITWHQALIRDLLNPSAIKDRSRQLATWTGHRSTIKKVIRTANGKALTSRTERNEGIVWRKAANGHLARRSIASLHEHIHRVVLLSDGDFLVCLHHDKITLWDCREFYAKEVGRCSYNLSSKPLCLLILPEIEQGTKFAHLATVSADMSGIAWELSLPGRSAQTNSTSSETGTGASIRQFCKFRLAAQDQVSYVLPVDPAGGAAIASDFLDIFAHDVAMSYSATGSLRTYTARIDRSRGVVDFLTTSTVETGLQNPSLGSATSIRRAALVDSSQFGLTIWDTRSGRLDHEEAFSDAIHDLDWASTPDNQSSILAVGFSRQVYIYSQLRYDYVTDGPAWERIKSIHLPDAPLPRPIGDSVWFADASLVIGSGNQLLIAPGTINATSDLAPELHSAIPHQRATSLYQLVRRMNGPLPVFHPQFIAQCVLAGKLDAVHKVLLKLLQTLKFYTEGDELDPFLGFDAEDFVTLEEEESLLTQSQHGMRSYTDDDSSTVTDAVAKSLNELLTQKSIPQLTSSEQISLASVIECVATVSTNSRSIDINASRYLLFWRSALIRSHRPARAPSIALADSGNPTGISWREVVFAYHSSSQDILVNLVLSSTQNVMSWQLARQSRMFTWLTSRETLLQQFENLAKAAYTATDPRDPVACSLHYLALRKKQVLVGLWRMATWSREQSATMKLLRNDFSDARWRTAAQKNAFALMGRRRFEYAAAFFLLADDLRSAIGVIANQLEDLDLALAVGRVYGGDDCPEVRDLVTQRVLRAAVREGDRWMATWAFWFLGERGAAVRSLVSSLDELVRTTLAGISEDNGADSKPVKHASLRAKSFLNDDPALIVVYEQLRAKSLQTLHGALQVKPFEEARFVMRTAGLYRRMGCHALALDLVRNWEFLKIESDAEGRESVPELPPSPSIARENDPRKMLMRRRSSIVVEDMASVDPRKVLLRRRSSLVVDDLPRVQKVKSALDGYAIDDSVEEEKEDKQVKSMLDDFSFGSQEQKKPTPSPAPSLLEQYEEKKPERKMEDEEKKKPTMFNEPEAASILDSFGF